MVCFSLPKWKCHPLGTPNNMGFLHNATQLSPSQRKAIAGLALVLAMTSTRVQAAEADAVLPQAPQWESGQVEQNDAPNRGIVVPGRYDGELKGAKTVREMRVSMTAYNSVPGQTDSTPFITADGSHVRDGIVAANFLKFGTRVRIPELFGDKVFEVHDRMNQRFDKRVDIWMEKVPDARAFGMKRNVKIEIL